MISATDGALTLPLSLSQCLSSNVTGAYARTHTRTHARMYAVPRCLGHTPHARTNAWPQAKRAGTDGADPATEPTAGSASSQDPPSAR